MDPSGLQTANDIINVLFQSYYCTFAMCFIIAMVEIGFSANINNNNNNNDDDDDKNNANNNNSNK